MENRGANESLCHSTTPISLNVPQQILSFYSAAITILTLLQYSHSEFHSLMQPKIDFRDLPQAVDPVKSHYNEHP